MATNRAPKIQRWIDLLAALLSRRYPVTLDDLEHEVPAYSESGKSREARARMFERDKDELRAFGVPIETIPLDDSETFGYRLAGKDFYLPYLCAVSPSGKTVSRSTRVKRYGYQTLSTLAFEPDELTAITQAAARIEALGDPLLIEETRSAMRKLALDLPLDPVPSAADTVLLTRTRADRSLFEALDEALRRRKVVEFTYHAMSTDRVETRHVEPYGLFFISGNWYLAGLDRDRNALRNFRLERIGNLTVNKATPQTPDYRIPATFDLREHARSRQAWELGDAETIDVVISVHGETGAVLAAARLGEPDPHDADRRLFRVRRSDAFVRWLMSFGGDLVPVSPQRIVTEFTDAVRRTLDVYATRSAS